MSEVEVSKRAEVADRPLVKYHPEPLEVLRARYPRALETVWDDGVIVDGQVIRPVDRQDHVFDTEDGFRVVCCRETDEEGAPYIHFSVSLIPYFAAWNGYWKMFRQQGKDAAHEAFLERGEAQFRAISGDTRKSEFWFYTHGITVPHWTLFESE